jgi:Fic family protein
MSLALDYDLTGAISYHYDRFPPAQIDYGRLLPLLSPAIAALARYDTKLDRIHNKELLLAPLRNAEAVVSSRIEGTIATLDEILRIQADDDEIGADEGRVYRQEAIEVYSYTRAVRHAQSLIEKGLPICSRLMREAHSRLMFVGRGADKTPGQFKGDQNYIADKRSRKVLFVPMDEKGLADGIAKLEKYIHDEAIEPLVQTAVMHVEFEALHPFKDGNGRLGRMLVPLNLWQRGVINSPHFYVSPAIEERREEYVDRLRAVSEHDDWTGWIAFFLEILLRQAELNMAITDKIEALYAETKQKLDEVLRSRWTSTVQDYIFTKGYFRNNSFTAQSGIPSQTAHKISRQLIDSEILTVVEAASGRRPAMLAFMPLLEVVRA